MKAKAVLVVVAFLAAAGAALPAAAQDGWKFTIAPYLVAAAMNGTVGVRGHDVNLDVPFDKVWDHLSFGGMVHFDMKNESWLVASDVVYMDLKQDAAVAGGSVNAGVTETFFAVTGGYRVSPALALFAGARLVDLGGDLRYSGALVDLSGSQSKTWVDPLLGAQVNAALSESWWLDVYGDIGGFGVGSKKTWQAYGHVGYKASDVVSLYVGYRALDIDYESGSGTSRFRYDVLSSGPEAGVAFHF